MIDFNYLGQKLAESNLTDKPVNQYSKEEVEKLVSACVESLQPDLKTEFVSSPFIDGGGNLRIPFDCDPKYRWWTGCGMSILEILRELKAPEETVRRYVKIEETVPF